VVYYAWASLSYRAEHGAAPGFVVPSGNIGNAVGALWAKALGFPVRHVAIATNANRVVPDWFDTGEWQPRTSIATLANAMDVGDPSNMERVFALYAAPGDALGDVCTLSIDDDRIRAAIRRAHARWGRAVCPHTATAIHFRDELPDSHWIVVATAHPAKFDGVVRPLVGSPVDVPPALEELLGRPTRVREIDAEIDELQEHWWTAGPSPS
jgi:threonine synthase